jgi:hypothetical protein
MIKKIVQRGFITRFEKEETWEVELYILPKDSEIQDYDAKLHYIDYGDGKPLREFYNFKTHPIYDVYCDEPYLETVVSEPRIEKASKFKERFKKAVNMIKPS